MRLSRIEIFPIKSLDAVERTDAVITAGGILENDRVYAITDLEGRVVNGKRTGKIHGLRALYDTDIKEVWLRHIDEASPTRFRLDEPVPIGRWLSDFFGFPVSLSHEPVKGFPDDTAAFGPTLCGLGSLLEIQRWYAGLSLDNVRRRFRTNLELDTAEPFREDELFGGPDELKPFRIGDVQFLGHNPCQRCIVPSRDPDGGEPTRAFQRTFSELRKQHLPEWSDMRRFNHFYRFAINSSILPSEAGKRLRIGDQLTR
jgi:hypothetical protein